MESKKIKEPEKVRRQGANVVGSEQHGNWPSVLGAIDCSRQPVLDQLKTIAGKIPVECAGVAVHYGSERFQKGDRATGAIKIYRCGVAVFLQL